MPGIKKENRTMSHNNTKASEQLKSNSLDEGIIAFGLWLNSENKQSSVNSVVLKEFVEGRNTVLIDNIGGREIIVETKDGVPFCTDCLSDDCMHVGFTICAEQLKRRSSTMNI